MPQKVLITGGSGLIGKHLSQLLLNKGYEVVWLSRRANARATIKTYGWDVTEKYIDARAFEGVSHIIHLSGTGVADKPWTQARKIEIRDSRIEAAKLLYQYVERLNMPIKTFVSSSGIGYYGSDTGNELKNENSNAGNDFLAKICRDWEAEANKFEKLNAKVVIIRTGVVLSDKGGALPAMALPIKFGVGAYLGTGNQWMSWIHIDDICNIYVKAIEEEQLTGIYNAVAPNPVTNKEFTKLLAKHLNRWVLPFYIPRFVFKLMFGEMSVVVTGSSHVLCKRLSEYGFAFRFRVLKDALASFTKI